MLIYKFKILNSFKITNPLYNMKSNTLITYIYEIKMMKIVKRDALIKYIKK